MGKLKWLRDPVTKEKIAPKTSIRAVFDDSGNRLDKLLILDNLIFIYILE